MPKTTGVNKSELIKALHMAEVELRQLQRLEGGSLPPLEAKALNTAIDLVYLIKCCDVDTLLLT